MRCSTMSIMPTRIPVDGGLTWLCRHSSSGATSGGGASTQCSSAPGSSRPSMNRVSTQTRSFCTSRARTWLAVRPARSGSTSTVAGPTSGELT